MLGAFDTSDSEEVSVRPRRNPTRSARPSAPVPPRVEEKEDSLEQSEKDTAFRYRLSSDAVPQIAAPAAPPAPVHDYDLADDLWDQFESIGGRDSNDGKQEDDAEQDEGDLGEDLQQTAQKHLDDALAPLKEFASLVSGYLALPMADLYKDPRKVGKPEIKTEPKKRRRQQAVSSDPLDGVLGVMLRQSQEMLEAIRQEQLQGREEAEEALRGYKALLEETSNAIRMTNADRADIRNVLKGTQAVLEETHDHQTKIENILRLLTDNGFLDAVQELVELLQSAVKAGREREAGLARENAPENANDNELADDSTIKSAIQQYVQEEGRHWGVALVAGACHEVLSRRANASERPLIGNKRAHDWDQGVSLMDQLGQMARVGDDLNEMRLDAADNKFLKRLLGFARIDVGVVMPLTYTPQFYGQVMRATQFVRSVSKLKGIQAGHLMVDPEVADKFAYLVSLLAQQASGGAAYQGPVVQQIGGNGRGYSSRKVWFSAGLKQRRAKEAALMACRHWFSSLVWKEQVVQNDQADQPDEQAGQPAQRIKYVVHSGARPRWRSRHQVLVPAVGGGPNQPIVAHIEARANVPPIFPGSSVIMQRWGRY